MTPDQQTTERNERSVRVLADAISHAIQENKGDKRFIDLTKIPLICLSIAGIHESLKEIKNMIVNNKNDSDEEHERFLTKEAFHLEFDTVKAVVYGGIGLVLVTIVGALLSVLLSK